MKTTQKITRFGTLSLLAFALLFAGAWLPADEEGPPVQSVQPKPKPRGEIVRELTEKRDAVSRHYLLEDGRILARIHGMKSISATATATILGMKVSVISCIWVTAWNMPIRRPVTSPKTSMGPATERHVNIACFATSWQSS